MKKDAIFEICDVESAAEQARTEARANAQRILQDAEREGRELLQENQAQSKAAAAEAIRRAEETGALRREEILQAARKDAKELQIHAEKQMALAVKVITERVVET